MRYRGLRSVYDELQAVAGEILGEFKQGAISLVQETPGSGPADDPGEPTVVTTALDAVASGVSWQYQQQGFNTETDLTVTAAVVAGITPSVNDSVTIDGSSYKIVKDISPPAAGTRVVWKFIVRR